MRYVWLLYLLLLPFRWWFCLVSFVFSLKKLSNGGPCNWFPGPRPITLGLEFHGLLLEVLEWLFSFDFVYYWATCPVKVVFRSIKPLFSSFFKENEYICDYTSILRVLVKTSKNNETSIKYEGSGHHGKSIKLSRKHLKFTNGFMPKWRLWRPQNHSVKAHILLCC